MNQHNTTKTQHHHIKKDSFRDKIYIKFLLHHFTSASNKDSVSQKRVFNFSSFFSEEEKTQKLKKHNRPKEQPRFWNRPHNKHNQQPVWNEYNTSDQFNCSNWSRKVEFTDCSHPLHLSDRTTLLYYTVCWTISQRPLDVVAKSERGVSWVSEGQRGQGGEKMTLTFFNHFFLQPHPFTPIPFSTTMKPTAMRRGRRFDVDWVGLERPGRLNSGGIGGRTERDDKWSKIVKNNPKMNTSETILKPFWKWKESKKSERNDILRGKKMIKLKWPQFNPTPWPNPNHPISLREDIMNDNLSPHIDTIWCIKFGEIKTRHFLHLFQPNSKNEIKTEIILIATFIFIFFSKLHFALFFFTFFLHLQNSSKSTHHPLSSPSHHSIRFILGSKITSYLTSNQTILGAEVTMGSTGRRRLRGFWRLKNSTKTTKTTFSSLILFFTGGGITSPPKLITTFVQSYNSSSHRLPPSISSQHNRSISFKH